MTAEIVTWSVVLYVSKVTGRVLGVDALCDRVEAQNPTEVLVLRVAHGLTEADAWALVQPAGEYGWVCRLPGAVRVNSYCVNVVWPR